jgi:putative two-component system response regulator
MNVLLKHDDYKDEISAWDIDIFVLMSQLHDIGKFGVKDSILNKTEKLTETEFEEMKKHTTFGLEIIHKLEESTPDNAFIKYAEILASSHHEKWDGSGYPLGLKGKGIPLQGRLMAIIDVYDALTKDRPHRGMLSHSEAVGIIKSCSGTQFDPELVEIFLEQETEFENVGVVNE